MRELVFTNPAGEVIRAFAGSDIKVTYVDITKNKAMKRKWRKMIRDAKKNKNTIVLGSGKTASTRCDNNRGR